MIYVLNAPIITNYGRFSYKPISLSEAKALLKNEFVSAVGHESTAKFMSTILGISIPVNRVEVKMMPGDKAIVFRVLKRLPEGAILSLEELHQIPYEIGLLIMEP